MTQPLDIAVVGSGIAGLSAAWLLARRHRVTLLEAAPRIGGHTNTRMVETPTGPCRVDTGFIVYNTATYPNLIAMLDQLGVATAATDMSFAVTLDGGRYEYKGNALGLFAQPSNLWSASHWRMIGDIVRFLGSAEMHALDPALRFVTLGDYLAEHGYRESFVNDHILPMAAAIWSTPSRDILSFPARSFLGFFANHGLLKLRGRPQWRTIVGGSHRYVERMLEGIGPRVRTSSAVTSVRREAGHVAVTVGGRTEPFDHVVLATHADEALRLLADPTGEEQSVLGAFRYAPNRAVLHRDATLMPRRRRAWASWNYLGSSTSQGPARTLSVSYWMNLLQPLTTSTDLFVTLNPPETIDPDCILAEDHYTHPMFDSQALAAQARLWSLQGKRGTWLAGSYFGHGFHEDALQAGLAVAEELGGVRRPWTAASDWDRIGRPERGWSRSASASLAA